jgi:nitrite reductase (NADH) small subunit
MEDRIEGWVRVCGADEVQVGGRKVISRQGREIGIFNVSGSYYAMRNYCPHQAGPICLGRVGGTMKPSRPHEYNYSDDDPVVVCPWHHWEYDLQTGQCLTDPRVRVKTYEVRVQSGDILIRVKRAPSTRRATEEP